MSFIGMWSSSAQNYLLVITTITFFAFSSVIFLKPLMWARLLTWRVPQDTDLTVYFARCLGSFAIVANILMLRSALYGTGVEIMFQFFILFSILMVVVHIWGALEDSQPKLETLEIGFWALMVILSLMFYPL